MATVYKRISHYCLLNKLQLPTRDQRAEIGKQVAHIYISEKKPATRVSRCESVEEEGTFTVISYPQSFVPVIDQFISEYVEDLKGKDLIQQIDFKPEKKPKAPVKRVRKKIPYKGR